MEPDRKLEKVKIVISFGKKASRKFSIKPPGGAYFFSSTFEGGLQRKGGSLFNLAKLNTGRIEFLPTGAKFLEGGLAVPGRYTTFSNNNKMVKILHRVLAGLKLKKLST